MSNKIICKICKFNKNNYCGFFNTQIDYLGPPDVCTGYKKKQLIKKKNNTKKKSIKQEKKLAKRIGAKRTPRSGAVVTSPGDMILGKYVIESKATNKSSVSLKQEWLSELKSKPILHGKIPVVLLDFESFGNIYYVIEENDFNKLIKED